MLVFKFKKMKVELIATKNIKNVKLLALKLLKTLIILSK